MRPRGCEGSLSLPAVRLPPRGQLRKIVGKAPQLRESDCVAVEWLEAGSADISIWPSTSSMSKFDARLDARMAALSA